MDQAGASGREYSSESDTKLLVDTSDAAPQIIRKRDGATSQPFDAKKIRRAIACAWEESSGTVDERAVEKVTRSVLRVFSDQSLIDVETVQDAVETALMSNKNFAVAKAYILYRQKRTEARTMRGKKPDPKALSDYIHASKYARFRSEFGRREVYAETVDRVEDMHISRFPALAAEIREAFNFVRDKRVLPSMRSMQFGGRAILSNHNRIYNCSFSLVDRLEAFGQAMFLLLCGCGVGYSVQFDHVEKLPPVGYVDRKKVQHHIIADSVEGWADALSALVQSYQDGVYLEFSYHLIRSAGAPLRTSGGRAPGHMKLKESLERVRSVLDAAQGRKLRPVECHNVMCFAADAVLSGGIRRSAMICLFSLDDSEMMNVKTGKWYEDKPWLANANNSVALKRDEVRKKQFRRIFEMTKQWGEPGFYFTNDYDYGTNPCVAAGTPILTRTGYVEIEKRLDQPTIIWNGIEWCTVTPKITGYNQPMVRVHLSDGTSLDVTDAHEWCIATGRWSRNHVEERVKSKDLEIGDVLMRYDMPVVEGGEDMAYAYTHGFWCADGLVEDADRKTAMLYGVKKDLVPWLDVERSSQHVAVDRIRVVLPDGMPEKFTVPINGSLRSRLDWLAGLLDGDGSVAKNPKSIGLSLASVHVQFLRDVRLMLTTLGVQAKIGDMDEGGMKWMPNGRGGDAEYLTQPCFRLTINAADTHTLVRIGLKTHRLDLSKAKSPPQRDARRFVHVEAVERLNDAPVVYCFTEESNHTGTFAGIVTGQCSEIGLNPRLVVDDQIKKKLGNRGVRVELGQVFTGWALCNLCEINAAKLTSLEDFMEVAKAATLIGTLQASYTSMPYLGWVSEMIAEREALLGIGMTGMLDAPHIACNPDYQRRVATAVKQWNEDFAVRLGIEPAARTTCIKPSGTTSLALGCVGSGHHAHHARRYIRRVTADDLEYVFQSFREINPSMCLRKPDGKWVIEFPVEAPAGATVKKDLDALRFLDMIKSTQQNWVVPGTSTTKFSPGLTHNVSNTVTVRADEWEKVSDYLWENREFFTGVSMLSDTGDKMYAFAPNEEIQTDADEARWNTILASYKAVDYTALAEASDETSLTSEVACAGGACSMNLGDAPVCDKCGHITVRSGAFYKCLSCGNSMGCS